MIPRSAGIRTHLARGAARADFLLEGDPRNFGGIAGQGSGFAYWAAGEKPKNYLGKAEIPLENCRLRARPSSARMHLAHPSQRADLGITSCLPTRCLLLAMRAPGFWRFVPDMVHDVRPVRQQVRGVG